MLIFQQISPLFHRQKLFSGVEAALQNREPVDPEVENLVIYTNPENELPANLKTLLDNILKACGISSANSLILNQTKDSIRFSQLRGLKLQRILIFGNPAPFLSSSAGLTRLKPGRFGDYNIIIVPDLPDMLNSQEAKTITWNALKGFYGIK